MDDIYPLCSEVWWRSWRSHVALHRAVPHHGLRTIDLPGKSARHRGVSDGASRQALPYGLLRASRATLADANESRDWRIYADFAQRLIAQARKLYANEDLELALSNTVYALDSTTIDLCLSLFPWAHFRTSKAAVKMHTLLDLRGSIPSFIHISDGKLHDMHALDLLIPEAGAIYVMDRGYGPRPPRVDFARLHVLHLASAFFVTRTKSNMDFHRLYSAQTDRDTGIMCDQTIALDGFNSKQDYPDHLRRIRLKDPDSDKTLVFLTNNFTLPTATIRALYKAR